MYRFQPEVGGLVVRLPLEVEIYRNTEHSMIGKRLKKDIEEGDRVALWYSKAQIMCETEMRKIAGTAKNGQIDGSRLTEDSSEFLQMYLDNQVSKKGKNNPIPSAPSLSI